MTLLQEKNSKCSVVESEEGRGWDLASQVAGSGPMNQEVVVPFLVGVHAWVAIPSQGSYRRQLMNDSHC